MQRLPLKLLGILVVLAVFSTQMWLVRGFELIVMRECYRLADNLDLLTGSRNGAMMIADRYFTRPPEWLRAIVQFIRPLIGLGPAVCTALIVHHRIVRPGTLSTARGRRRALMRIMICWITFALLVMLGDRYLADALRQWIFDLGVKAGCQYVAIGTLLVGADGPFFGGKYADLFNLLWRNAPHTGPRILAFLAALMLHRFLIHSLRRSDGLCNSCGYDLRANRSGICPECGESTN